MMDGSSDVRMTQSGLKTEFLAFSLPPTQSSIESTREVEYSPLASINPNSETHLIEFSIPGSSEEFIDLDSVFIKVKLSYTGNKTGAVGAAGGGKPTVTIVSGDVCPVNNLLHSLFARVELTLGSTVVNPNSNLYPYRAYIETLLGYSNEAKNTFLKPSGWLYSETEDETRPSPTRGRAWLPNSDLDLFGMLHLDMGGQDKLILNGTPVRLALHTASPKFFLHANPDVRDIKVEFKDVKLYVTKKKATTAQINITERSLSSTPASYAIRRIEMREHLIARNSTTVCLDNVFSGPLPTRIIMGLVDNSATGADLKKNPFNFEHFDMNYACCYVNGEAVPRIAYRPDFKNDHFSREYVSLYQGIGKMNPHPFCDLTLESYKNGHTLTCFNLSADGSDSSSGHFNPIRRGTIRLDLGFETAVSSTVSVILFAEYDSVVLIDRHRNAVLAF